MVIKGTLGTYDLFHLLRDQHTRIRASKTSLVGQDVKFILSNNKKFILDVITHKLFNDVRFCKIEIETGDISWIRLSPDTRVVRSLSLSPNGNRITFLHNKAIGKIDGELKREIEVIWIDYNSLNREIMYKSITSVDAEALLFFGDRYFLNGKMEIIDISAQTPNRQLDIQYDSNEYGYYRSAYLYKDKYLLLVFTKRIILFDCLLNTLLFEYQGNCLSGCLCDNRIFIGTYDGVYIEEFCY